MKFLAFFVQFLALSCFLSAQTTPFTGNVDVSNSIFWGSTGAVLGSNQGASIELRGNGIPYFDFSNDPTTDFDMRMILLGNDLLSFQGGSVGINTQNTGSHKLAVNGSIGARRVKVEVGTWSDFVFNKNYNLPSIQEVEEHIQIHGHLKDIPSEKEVLEKGVDLGEMDAKLLQKIEELTLYIIELEKTTIALKERLDQIEGQN